MNAIKIPLQVPIATILVLGNYIVLCRDISLYKLFLPNIHNIISNLNFELNGNSDMIRIFETNYNIIDSVAYNDFDP